MTSPHFVNALTEDPLLQDALHRLEIQVAPSLRALGRPDLALVFFTPHFSSQVEALQSGIRDFCRPRHLLGAGAAGVIGAGREIEDAPAISLTLGWLPQARIAPLLLHHENWNALVNSEAAFREAFPIPEDTRCLLLLADPFSVPIGGLLDALNDYYPGLPAAGGMASAGRTPGNNVLLCDGQRATRGLAALALGGDFQTAFTLAQGCRPIGEPLSVTLAHRNVILRLENSPATEQLQQVIEGLPREMHALVRQGVFMGCAIDPHKEQYGRGDFLIRPIIGLDQRSGAIALSDYVRSGDVVQFFVRDPHTAAEDLEMLLLPHSFRPAPAGALLFTCIGRGRDLYGHPDGDVAIIRESLGADLPLGGMFCNGEIGMVGGKNYLHGHSASLVLFW